MQNRRGITAIDPAGQKDHVRTKVLKLAHFFMRELERRRADDLRARAERGLVRGLDRQSRHIADDRDEQTAGRAARSKNDFSSENRQVRRFPVEDRIALMQTSESFEQTVAHVGADSRRRLAPADQLRRIKVDRNEFSEGAAKINQESEGRHTTAKGKSSKKKCREMLSIFYAHPTSLPFAFLPLPLL